MAHIWDLFKGYEKAHGRYEIKSINSRGKAEGKAFTIHKPATQVEWDSHLTGSGAGLGIIPLMEDNTVWWAVIDIDEIGIDHAALEKKIKALSLPLIIARSKSGGAHCFIFTKEPLDAVLVQDTLEGWAAALGYGGSEIFPKQTSRYNESDVGNWLNMPYYDEPRTLRYGVKNGKALSLKAFIKAATRARVTQEQLEGIELTGKKAPSNEGLFENGPPCLQILHAQGGFPEGTRNEGMYDVAVYLRKRFPDDWKDKIQEYNIEMSDPPLSIEEISQLAKSISKKDYNYRCKQPPINCHCHRRVCLGRTHGVGESADGPGRIEIGYLVQLNGDPVLWFVEIAGHRLMMTTDELLNQNQFKRKVAEKIRRVPTTIPQARWDRYIDEKMRTADVIESPEDASPFGQFAMLLEQYCNGMAQATTKEELAYRFNPYRTGDGEVWFRSKGFLDYIAHQGFKVKSEHHAWQMLRELGAVNRFINVKNKGFNVWVVPEPDPPLPEQPLPKFGTEEF